MLVKKKIKDLTTAEFIKWYKKNCYDKTRKSNFNS